MRLLVIADHSDPLDALGSKEAGGQNAFLRYMAKFMGKRGVKGDIFTRLNSGSKQRVVSLQNGWRVVRLAAGPKSYYARDDFWNLLPEFQQNLESFIEDEKEQYDAIYSHYWFSGVVGMALKKKLKIPLVHTYHSIGQVRYEVLREYKQHSAQDEFFARRLEEEKKIADEADKLLVTSPVEASLVKRLWQVPDKRLAVIPIGIDHKMFKPMSSGKARAALKVKETAPIILYVGRIEWRKGLGTLMHAFGRVKKDFPEARFMIVGGGKLSREKQLDRAEVTRLKEIAKELGVSSSVHFWGRRPQSQLRNFYGAADVCVIPSYYEPFGIVAIEAMACGTPVVASETGGLKYIIKDGITGYLAKPRDYRDLAAKIVLTLKRPKKDFSQACVQRVEDRFRWENVIKSFIITFRDLKDKK